MNPFVKWAGGKSQLLPELTRRIPPYTGTYYEPFLGGGALLLNLQPNRAVLNDINASLLNVYAWIKTDVQGLIACLDGLNQKDCNQALYNELRETYNRQKDDKSIQSAALFIWLNKYSFNGLYRVNKSGNFNVPWNKKTHTPVYDKENLYAISAYLRQNQVVFKNADFEETCQSCAQDDFVYFDSPYVPMGKSSDFTNYTKDGFAYQDHVRLRNLLDSLSHRNVKCMLSNNDTYLVHDLYKNYRIESIPVHRNINANGRNRTSQEVIITNY